MNSLHLHEFHAARGARFLEVNGREVVAGYGDVGEEVEALRKTAGVMDLSMRGRLCLAGGDRQRFLNGQVTNNVKDLPVGAGCYAALVTAKGKIESDLNVYVLPEELLMDLEPGSEELVRERLDRFIIADDVEVIDVTGHYGQLTVQGPEARSVLKAIDPAFPVPAEAFAWTRWEAGESGEAYCMRQPRGVADGYDLFLPTDRLTAVAARWFDAAAACGGRGVGWDAMEVVRIEEGIPRFGQDMDATNLAPETGIVDRAISYSKGCYIGQEVIARIRTYGQVTRELRGLVLADDLGELPAKGTALRADGKEIGYLTSAVASPKFGRKIALGYVRKEHKAVGNRLVLSLETGDREVRVVDLPFQADQIAVES